VVSGQVAFAVTGNSSSLVARSVSALNPRVVAFRMPDEGGLDADFAALGFARGEQLVELAAYDPGARDGKGNLAFFLVRYEQKCNATGSCTNAELLTAKTEVGWQNVSVYSQDDLKNTTLDCLQCHEPNGPGSRRILRMQERKAPWTHFFAAFTTGGSQLVTDFTTAHGSEGYGPIPAGRIAASNPAALEQLVERAGCAPQPNEFDSMAIEVERCSGDTTTANPPPSWQRVYDVARAGDAIAVPFYDWRVTDPNKVVSASVAFAGAMVAGGNVPDVRDVFRDDVATSLGFVPAPSENARAILAQTCRHCHNAGLDQTLSRARFDVDRTDTMPAAERALAVARLRLPESDAKHMPPARFHSLSPAEIESVALLLTR
jgi:hypothetical protein